MDRESNRAGPLFQMWVPGNIRAAAVVLGLALITGISTQGLGQSDPDGGGGVSDHVDPASLSDAASQTNVTEMPDFMQYKSRISDYVLKDKREGSYYTGIPLIGYDPEQGFNFGAAIQRFENGPRDSPYFTHAPYRQKLSIAAAASTGGSAKAILALDQPYLNDTPWRIGSYVGWTKSERENYFGNNSDTLNPLSFPGAPGQTYDRLGDYENAIERVNNGVTYSKYNLYYREDFIAALNVEYDLMGGRLRPLFGLQVDYTDIDDYTGERHNGGTNAPTLLRSDRDAGRILGFNGGWNNLLRVGLTYDTRDYEPNPTSGYVIQVLAQGGLDGFLSDYTYGQVTVNAQAYYPLFPSMTRLVMAGQVGYSVKGGELPFYAQPNLALPNAEARRGLGGFQTMRGYITSRFSSDVLMHANAELRWTFGGFTLFNQKIDMMLVPFVDTGRVFDSVADTTLQDWKVSGGAGLRLAWNVATIISFDYGVSSESSLFWMEIGHQF